MSLSRARAATALALLLAATACTAAPEEPTPGRHSTAPPPFSRQARQLALPLDAYASNDDNIHAIEDAQDILMRRCMNRLGKEWKVLPRVSARDVEPQNLRRYGVIEAEAARRYGYHPRPEPESMVRRNRAWDERDRLPADVRRAAYGRNGQGGCSKTSRDQLGGGTAQPEYHAFNQLTSAALEASRRTPEVRSAKRKWSACMVKKGFRDAMAAGGGKRWQTAGPTPAERETASADVACKQETDLVTVWASAETRIQRRLIRQHAKELREAKARHDHWLAAARRVLNREGG
ncbi:hypothetical protein [Streptomyces chattanoogensis]|uniref:hypothetical protein n=1 Tax=Streptomyces chattanoogensis TaxID=66876 RepID=UPI0005D8220C|nr:hypothetical protein T261_3820 [Streptomyces lydicus]